MDSPASPNHFPLIMSTINQTLFQLLQGIAKSNEALLVLTQKLNERIDHLEAKIAALVPKTGPCYRCGREGHWASACYARTHLNGTALESESEGYNSE